MCYLLGEPSIVYGYVINVMKNSKFHCGRVSKVSLFLVSKTNYITDDYIVINVIKRHGVDAFFKSKY